jgi:aspartate kinase
VTVGAIVPTDAGVRFSAPGADTHEVTAALEAVGLVAKVDEELGSVSVVSLGIARKPDIAARALAALEADGIRPRLVTSTPGRVSVSVPTGQVDDAVRLLHRIFIHETEAESVSALNAPTEAA